MSIENIKGGIAGLGIGYTSNNIQKKNSTHGSVDSRSGEGFDLKKFLLRRELEEDERDNAAVDSSLLQNTGGVSESGRSGGNTRNVNVGNGSSGQVAQVAEERRDEFLEEQHEQMLEELREEREEAVAAEKLLAVLIRKAAQTRKEIDSESHDEHDRQRDSDFDEYLKVKDEVRSESDEDNRKEFERLMGLGVFDYNMYHR